MTSGRGEPLEVLVAFPGAGGSAGMFAGLRACLAGHLQLLIPDTPGRGRRTHAAQTDVRELAAELCPELRERISGRPYAVFSACIGTVTAFELVCEQRRRGLPMPSKFLVCGRAAPDLAGGLGAYADWSDDMLDMFLRESLPPDYDWDRMPPELLGVLRRRIRKDIELVASYEYREEEQLDVAIHAFHGDGDTETTRDDLESWRGHAAGRFDLHEVPGGAYFYLTNPEALAQALTGPDGP
ncbi:thioesterase II family protein [Spongiactinospora sp. 9N601]|uniref:thioesterase II family protein n=1 Tax=Spongiactinospora sp. 9N601 TaxID=3375149 RepID=UPI003793DE85